MNDDIKIEKYRRLSITTLVTGILGIGPIVLWTRTAKDFYILII